MAVMALFCTAASVGALLIPQIGAYIACSVLVYGGYAVSQRIRKRIEEAFGWIKTIAGQEKTSFRGRDRVAWAFTFAAAAYNLVRLPKLIAEAG
jgi:hypothetical protein